jgi:hypothetical protein
MAGLAVAPLGFVEQDVTVLFSLGVNLRRR